MIEAEKIIDELLKFSSQILSINGPITDNRVENFEEKYKLNLPQDYKYIIKRINGFSLMGTGALGIHSEPKTESLESVYLREHNEIENPQYSYLVPFHNDGRGNFYCFDTRFKTNNGQSCPIVFWQSDYLYNEKDLPEVTNESFLDWVNEVVIGWTLDDYDYNGNEK